MTKCYEGSKERENSNVLPTRSLKLKVSAGVGTGRYFLLGGSCKEMVHCRVLNSNLTHRDSNNCIKLLTVTPVQIKPKLFRVIVNSFAWQVSFLNYTLVIYFIGLPRRRSTSIISVRHTVRVAMSTRE